MKKFDLARAWKDSAYFAKLDAVQQQAASSPVGVAELDAALVDTVGGGGGGTSFSGFSTWCTVCQP
jgi:mersacidin/lichenicidin family type 2 lantibiotic